MKQSLFTSDELKRIEATIAEAKARTSGEIVAMVVKRSSDYRWTHWFWATLGWMATSLVLVLLDARGILVLPTVDFVTYQILGALLFGALSNLSPLQRFVLTPRQAAWRVHREALANFTACGLHETHHRTGILIYLSLLERRVQILADTGIHGKTGEPYWNEMVTEIVSGIKKGRTADALCEVIRRIGDLLTEHFPPLGDHHTELSNKVRLEPADQNG